MKHFPAQGGHLEHYQVGDTDVLTIANENGDITAHVHRADGTQGHAYGGPVYDPPEFENTCARPSCLFCDKDGACPIANGVRRSWLTVGELAMATALARKVGWL